MPVGMADCEYQLARADIDDVRVRRSDGNRADRANRNARRGIVRNGEPGAAGVLGLPNTAAYRAHVKKCPAAPHFRLRRKCARRALGQRRATPGRKAFRKDIAVQPAEVQEQKKEAANEIRRPCEGSDRFLDLERLGKLKLD